ncbi:NUDIX domain-containing protein [Microbacterium sp. ET2]|uniref:NUDIX hydrolase n=1 Tax=Microbacterium albipurpureum TaxID=3050384 RepID=UPI00259CBAB8|nr:NUDIX domain-containing protein [Microbacterium sp. ET2 (Ac-2212)]WJL95009.1 NUDIX domain-containing protein [Microbacterium sp. ET2 (Ac-2212)]
MNPHEIRVSAGLVTDAAGRALLVRKSGTRLFMNPGGKPEPGENPAETLVRELHEELGLSVAAASLHPLGVFRTAAANEPGHDVVADAFGLQIDPAGPTPRAEIAEARWITPEDAATTPLAPLCVVLLPLVWGADYRP